MWKHITKRTREHPGDEPLDDYDEAEKAELKAIFDAMEGAEWDGLASQQSRQQSAPWGEVEDDDGGGPKKKFKRSLKKPSDTTLGATQPGVDLLMDSVDYAASGMTPVMADQRQSAAVPRSSSMVDPHNQLPPTITSVHSSLLPLHHSDSDQDRPLRGSPPAYPLHPGRIDPSLQSTSAQSGTSPRHLPPPSDPNSSDHLQVRFATRSDRHSEPEGQEKVELEMLDDRHDTEPGITPNPSAKQAFGVIAGSNKWIKFITVVPGKHGRFKINAGMDPIYGGFSDVWRCDARLSDGRIINVSIYYLDTGYYGAKYLGTG